MTERKGIANSRNQVISRTLILLICEQFLYLSFTNSRQQSSIDRPAARTRYRLNKTRLRERLRRTQRQSSRISNMTDGRQISIRPQLRDIELHIHEVDWIYKKASLYKLRKNISRVRDTGERMNTEVFICVYISLQQVSNN